MRLFASLALGFSANFVPSVSAADVDLADLHLDIAPRSASESARIAKVVAPTTDFTKAEPFEANQAGAATVRPMGNTDAFSQASGNISFDQELDFKIGNGLFRKLWVSSPSSTLASDGLGPLYNARSCQRCHLKDGRGHPPEGAQDSAVSLLMRISIPEEQAIAEIEGYLASVPDPTYGTQIQDFSIAGHPAEAQVAVNYREEAITLSGGEQATLRQPSYGLSEPGYGAFHPELIMSPRIAPQMIGLGSVSYTHLTLPTKA